MPTSVSKMLSLLHFVADEPDPKTANPEVHRKNVREPNQIDH